jgi:hypothetical protein
VDEEAALHWQNKHQSEILKLLVTLEFRTFNIRFYETFKSTS